MSKREFCLKREIDLCKIICVMSITKLQTNYKLIFYKGMTIPDMITSEPEIRIIKKFLWFPLELNNVCMWLKKCYIKQIELCSISTKFFTFRDWDDIEFLSDSEYLEWRLLNE